MDEAARPSDTDARSGVPIVSRHDQSATSISEADGYRVLVPHSHAASVAAGRRRVRLAAAIAAEQGGDVVIVGLPQVPAETPLDAFDAESAAETRSAVEELVATGDAADVPIRGIVWLTHAESRAIAEAVGRYGCAGIVAGVPADGSHRRRVLSGETSHDLLGEPACDVYLERTPEVDYAVDRIMVAVAGGPHSELATDTARLIARHHDATLNAVRVIEPDATDDARAEATALLEDVADRFRDIRHETRLIEATDVAEGLVRESNDYDLTVLGAPRKGVLERFVFGSVSDSVVRSGSHAVVMVRQGGGT